MKRQRHEGRTAATISLDRLSLERISLITRHAQERSGFAPNRSEVIRRAIEAYVETRHAATTHQGKATWQELLELRDAVIAELCRRMDAPGGPDGATLGLVRKLLKNEGVTAQEAVREYGSLGSVLEATKLEQRHRTRVHHALRDEPLRIQLPPYCDPEDVGEG